MAKRKLGEPHVRLYRHEIQSAAYRSLSIGARALLVEFRALYNGKENRIFMSVREAMKRTGLCQQAAQRAIADLLDRGFIRLLDKGSFHCKRRNASVFLLTNEAPDNRDGSVAPKDFMRWQPQKRGIGIEYRAVSESNTEAPSNATKKRPTVAESNTVDTKNYPTTVAESNTQIVLPGSALVSESVTGGSKRAGGSLLRLVTP